MLDTSAYDVLISDSMMSHIDHIFSSDYVPTNQDILQSWHHTTGITETRFDIREISHHVFDVGGARSERKNWVRVFEDVYHLIFMAPLSGYDECLVEDRSTVRTTLHSEI